MKKDYFYYAIPGATVLYIIAIIFDSIFRICKWGVSGSDLGSNIYGHCPIWLMPFEEVIHSTQSFLGLEFIEFIVILVFIWLVQILIIRNLKTFLPWLTPIMLLIGFYATEFYLHSIYIDVKSKTMVTPSPQLNQNCLGTSEMILNEIHKAGNYQNIGGQLIPIWGENDIHKIKVLNIPKSFNDYYIMISPINLWDGNLSNSGNYLSSLKINNNTAIIDEPTKKFPIMDKYEVRVYDGSGNIIGKAFDNFDCSILKLLRL